MKGYQETQDAVKKAMAEFPSVFGLVAYPGEIFRISVAHSYFNDSDVLMLYTEIKKKGVWLSFCKGSVSELRSQVRELKMSVAERRCQQCECEVFESLEDYPNLCKCGHTHTRKVR